MAGPATICAIILLTIFPLVVAISLVYGATRHELPGPILNNAFRFGVWMLGFIGAIFVVLFWISRGL